MPAKRRHAKRRTKRHTKRKKRMPAALKAYWAKHKRKTAKRKRHGRHHKAIRTRKAGLGL